MVSFCVGHDNRIDVLFFSRGVLLLLLATLESVGRTLLPILLSHDRCFASVVFGSARRQWDTIISSDGSSRTILSKHNTRHCTSTHYCRQTNVFAAFRVILYRLSHIKLCPSIKPLETSPVENQRAAPPPRNDSIGAVRYGRDLSDDELIRKW